MRYGCDERKTGGHILNWPDNNDCYLKFEGLMVDMICDIDPAYKKVCPHQQEDKEKEAVWEAHHSSVWYVMGCYPFLPEVERSTIQVGVRVEPVQSVYFQQDSQRRVADDTISCG